MTDNEIVKALRCCKDKFGRSCFTCPLKDDRRCLETLPHLSLEIINRQKAEIERLKEAYAAYEETTGLKWARAEAIKEFAERIEPELANNTEISSVGYQSIIAIIINLVKEMTEETP